MVTYYFYYAKHGYSERVGGSDITVNEDITPDKIMSFSYSDSASAGKKRMVLDTDSMM